ncbi:MAG: translation initiation factor [Muribaculum sp.]|nr:translation initiation factor [Muribaculum sp.]
MSRQSLSLSDALNRLVSENPDLNIQDENTVNSEDTGDIVKSWPRLDISYERKGRGGKPATIISGFTDDNTDEDIAELASTLRRSLATGGSSRGGEILLQGDRRKQALDLLNSMGIKARII